MELVSHVDFANHHSSPLAKICLGLMGIVMVIFFLSMGGAEKDQDSVNLRSGQAMQHHTSSASGSGSTSERPSVPPKNPGGEKAGAHGGSWIEGNDRTYTKADEEENLEETVDETKYAIVSVEQDEVEKNQEGLLGKALSKMEGAIKKSVTKLLGDDATKKDVEELVGEVEGALVNATAVELKVRAAEVALKAENEIDTVVEVREEAGDSAGEIEEQVAVQQSEKLIAVRDAVDSAAVDIRQHLQERAMEFEKSIMEKKLSERDGKTHQTEDS